MNHEQLPETDHTFRPNYFRVWSTFFRNSLVREMTFRANFLITLVTRAFWLSAQLLLFEVIYSHVDAIGDWTRYEYFAFMATGMLVNAIVETFFMPNCANFSELIRTGDLDFALLKPIDTQFLVSFEKVNLPMLVQVVLAGILMWYSLAHLDVTVTAGRVLTYFILIAVAVAFFYSLMIALAATSVWFGRNQGLYDFWFYVTVFARYPREIYAGSAAGDAISFGFSFIIPILLVMTIPSRVLLGKVL
ncbi:MAG: ABC-2 family transporter protein, partial [Planctomycetaceae bacterium]|nr:ABC-2 family transporter protein [Planctomycetaceae bacterium]